MSNVGSAAAGKTLIGAGNGASPTFADIGTNSGLTAHGVVVSEGNSAFSSLSPGSSGQVLVSNGASLDPTFQNLSAVGAVTTITGNSGSATPTTGNINLVTANSTVKVVGSGSTLTEDFGITNLLLGSSGPSIAAGTANTAVGFSALNSVAGGISNVAIGYQAGDDINSGNENVCVGRNSGGTIAGGGQNVCIGQSAGATITSGSSNILIGKTAGNSFSGGAANNICIGEGVTGSGAVSNSIRIGSTHTTCFVDGITGVTVAASAPIGVDSNDQLSSLGFGTAGQLFVSGGAGVSPAFASSSSINFTFTNASAGRTLTVSSTDNTVGTSNAVFASSVGGTSGGDPYTLYAVSTTRSYAVGIDNSDTQSFIVNTAATGSATPSSGNRVMRIDNSGNLSLPLNSCVTADLNTGLTNATGDATFINPLIFDTDTGGFFDQNGNYDTTTGIFTAPATGKYLVTARVTFNGIGVAHTAGIVRINLNGSAYMISNFNPALSANASGEYTADISGILPIAATGTCAILAQVSGSTKTVGVKGNASGSFTSLSVVLIS